MKKREKELKFRDKKVKLRSHHLVKNIQRTEGKFTLVQWHNMKMCSCRREIEMVCEKLGEDTSTHTL